MATATWRPIKQASIDSALTTTTDTALRVGKVIGAGGDKDTGNKRALLAFDLTTPPIEGALPAGTPVVHDATLTLHVDTIDGASKWPMLIDRITQPAWYNATLGNRTTWEAADGPTLWVTPGGDYDTALELALRSPSALGDFTITGLAQLVADALVSRAGRCDLILRATTPDPPISAAFDCLNDITSAQAPRLTVTFADAGIIDSRDPPSFAGVRPAFTPQGARARRPAPPARPHTIRR